MLPLSQFKEYTQITHAGCTHESRSSGPSQEVKIVFCNTETHSYEERFPSTMMIGVNETLAWASRTVSLTVSEGGSGRQRGTVGSQQEAGVKA